MRKSILSNLNYLKEIMGDYYGCHTKIKLKPEASDTTKLLLKTLDEGELPDYFMPLFSNIGGRN